jgi:hypothetical protein
MHPELDRSEAHLQWRAEENSSFSVSRFIADYQLQGPKAADVQMAAARDMQ